MSSDQHIQRICEICGADCSESPRVKVRGGYRHKTCHDESRTKRRPTESITAHESQSQDPISTEDEALPPSAAFTVTALSLSLVGALVGGVISVAIWATIVEVTRSELMILMAFLGILPGAGAAVLSLGRKGMLTGVIASAVALAAAAGAIYVGCYCIIKKDIASDIAEYRQELSRSWMTEMEAKEDLAYRAALRAEREGQTLDWPKGMDLSIAVGILDYPASIAEPIRSSWSELDSAARSAKIDEVKAEQEITYAANLIVIERLEAGELVQWPVGMTFEHASLIEDFPPEIVTIASDMWHGMNREQQVEYVLDQSYIYTEYLSSFRGVMQMMKSEYELADIILYSLLTLVSLVLAYVIGAGVNIEKGTEAA